MRPSRMGLGAGGVDICGAEEGVAGVWVEKGEQEEKGEGHGGVEGRGEGV